MVDRLNKPDKGTKDWHVPLNENFEDVEEASYVERTVADFEGGTLDTDVWKESTGDFSIVDDPESSGFGSVLKSSAESAIYTLSGLDTYPQAGDSFDIPVYFTDTNDFIYLNFFVQDGRARGTGNGQANNCYYVILDNRNDSLTLDKRKGGSTQGLDSTTVELSNNLNSWLTLSVEVGKDGDISASILNGAVSANDETWKSGGLRIGADNPNDNPNIYVGEWTLERRETQARTNTQKGTTQLGNEVVPSGSIQTGPTTSSTNAKRAIYQDAPVDNTATQGTQSKLTLLQSGLNPAMFMERTLDGQGGAYEHRIAGSPARIWQENEALYWNYQDANAEVPWSIENNNSQVQDFGILDGTVEYPALDGDDTLNTPDRYPRELAISSDGSGSDSDRMGVTVKHPIPIKNLGSIRLNYVGCEAKRRGANNAGFNLRMPDGESIEGIKIVGDSIDNNARKIGASSPLDYSDFDGTITVSVEIDTIRNEYRWYAGGYFITTESVSSMPDHVYPEIFVSNEFQDSERARIRCKSINLEPLSGVLQ